MADSDRKRPQCDDLQPSPASDALSPSKRTRGPSNQNDNLSDEVDDGRVFSMALRNKAKNVQTSANKNDSDSDDDDYTSSSGSDSDEDDTEDDDEEEEQKRDVNSDDGSDHSLPRIPARQKPQIYRIEKKPDILSRLSAFLPQMKSANDELQREIDAGRAQDLMLDDVDDQTDGQYIEMNLGLGVLEEKRPDDAVVPGEKNDGSEASPACSHAGSHPNAQTDSNVLGTLMGNNDSTTSKKPTIVEMNE